MEEVKSRLAEAEKDIRTIKASSEEMSKIMEARHEELKSLTLVVFGGDMKIPGQNYKVKGLLDEIKEMGAEQKRHKRQLMLLYFALVGSVGTLLGVKGLPEAIKAYFGL